MKSTITNHVLLMNEEGKPLGDGFSKEILYTARVAVCKHTENEVVQVDEGQNGKVWLCLHNNSIKQDLKAVEHFRKTGQLI